MKLSNWEHNTTQRLYSELKTDKKNRKFLNWTFCSCWKVKEKKVQRILHESAEISHFFTLKSWYLINCKCYVRQNNFNFSSQLDGQEQQHKNWRMPERNQVKAGLNSSRVLCSLNSTFTSWRFHSCVDISFLFLWCERENERRTWKGKTVNDRKAEEEKKSLKRLSKESRTENTWLW